MRANRQAASASGLRVAVSVVLQEYEPLKRGAPRQRRYREKVGPPTMKGEYLLGVNDTFTFGLGGGQVIAGWIKAWPA